MILSGAFGNILDRAINSCVFDFISLNYGNFYWPAFNLADIYITVGIIMLITSIFINFDQKNEKYLFYNFNLACLYYLVTQSEEKVQE